MSTQNATLRQAVETQFLSGWDTVTTPVKLDNSQGLLKGTGRIHDESNLTEWCHLSIFPSSANQVDMNALKMVRSTGTIFVNVFVKSGEGTDRAWVLADKVASLLQLNKFDAVLTRAAVADNMGQTPDNSFYQVTVKIPYQRDEFLSN